jgi:methyl-accepting chemotaxis protein
MAEGNLSVKMTGQYQGDYAALKHALNTTVDLMPFQECIAILQELSTGNFNVTMQGSYKGDSLDLKNALNKTIDSVSQTLAQVIAVVEQVSLGAQQVATASNDLAQGAQHQAAALEEISSSMTEIGAQTKLNAKGSEQANMLVQESQRTAELGTTEMERLTQAMNAISDGSRNISKIIKVIDEIAFQTNLLALNAAVEAARAGRHGLGFAVVAEEVRNLAARSATAAKETADLIEGSIEKVQNGNALVGKTGEVLHRIAENSTVVAQNVAEIASASKEQSTAIDQINIGLNQIDSVTQQNTANTESSATAAEELSAQARELRALIARFQLSNSHAHIANGFGSVGVGMQAAPSKTRQTNTQVKRPTSQNNGNGNGNYTSTSLERHVAALDSSEFDRY